MNCFNAFIERVLMHEGGYVNNPRDPGGETNWGVSKRSYPLLSIASLTRQDAIGIYRRDYWNKMQCDKMPAALAFQVLDAAINHGRGNATRWLQRIVGVAEDGIIGPLTMAAIEQADALGLVFSFNSERLRFYASLSTFGVFGRGWIRRVAINLQFAAIDISLHGKSVNQYMLQKDGDVLCG